MNVTARLRARRAQARKRRAVDAAIANSTASDRPAARHDLMVIAQQTMNIMR